MEAEGQQYREAALQKNNQIKSLERRVTSLEQELQEAHARVGKAAWKHEYGLRCSLCSNNKPLYSRPRAEVTTGHPSRVATCTLFTHSYLCVRRTKLQLRRPIGYKVSEQP